MSPKAPFQSNAASKSEAEVIASLEAEIRDFTSQRESCARKVKELLFSENISQGVVYAKEIFRLQQDKLRLQVEIDCRRNKINRIRTFGLAEEVGPNPSCS